MESAKHFIISLLVATVLIIIGTLGYIFIEGWDFLDSLYMTVITLATVGYKEVHPISRTGKVYTIILITTGVGFFLYVAGAVIQFMVEGRVRILMGRRRLDRKIARLKNHFIICGYGRIGRVLCDKLQRENYDLVIVENESEHIETFETKKMPYICADAGDESTLVKAGIHKAAALIAVLGTDTENVFLVLTARQIAPNLQIFARAASEKAKVKLSAAGANTVEAPYETGAATMAQRIIRPNVTNFLDLAFAHEHNDIFMEEIPVSGNSRLNNVMLKDSGIRQKYNLIIIAIKKADDKMIFNPSFEARIHGGDTVIAVGTPDGLKKLEAELNPQ
ncbi:MAG: potassium channel protein [Desulfobacteraceae bacterium]|nr:potassium channel protein [Desulfobacteraceae bacterium]